MEELEMTNLKQIVSFTITQTNYCNKKRTLIFYRQDLGYYSC